MSQFNKNTKTNVDRVVSEHPDVTVNKEGGVAFRPSAKMELMMRSITSMISDGFYETESESRDAKKRLVDEIMSYDPLFPLKQAVFDREVLNLRSETTFLLGEFSLNPHKSDVENSRSYVSRAIKRPDDMTELAAYVMSENKKRHVFKGRMPLVVKNALADAFTKFDVYQIAKYNKKADVTMKDIMCMVHPVPKDEKQAVTFKKLHEGTMEAPYTWEVQLSTKGNNAEVWHDLIWSGRLPYMATLRNLRNMLKVGVSSSDIDEVVRMLTDPKGVANSKQFPYRFYSANREISKARLWSPDPVDDTFEKSNHRSTEADRTKFMDALDIALEMSVDNIPDLEGTTFITCDNSGSMENNPVSTGPVRRVKYHDHDVDSPKITCKDVSTLFGAIMHKKCKNSIVSVFADRFATVPLSKRASIFDNMKKIGDTDVGGSTYADKALDYLTDNDVKVDRIIMLTDEQCYSEMDNIPRSSGRFFSTHDRCDTSVYASFLKYKRKVNPKVFMYVINLASYGTIQIPESEKNVCTMGGYSDKVLSFIPVFEQSHEGMLDAIEKISIN
jgi:60 kDa SS-A/Ro ribonucleoprotein